MKGKYMPEIEDPNYAPPSNYDDHGAGDDDLMDKSWHDGYSAGVRQALDLVRSSKMGHPLVVAQLSLIEDALNSLLLPCPTPKEIDP